MKSQELRALIASKQLAALVTADAIFCINEPGIRSHAELTDEAIALADLLLAKLGESKPAKSAPGKMDWRPFSIIKPGESCSCWVIEWDCVGGCIKNAWLATWTEGRWENVMGTELFIGGRGIEIYWQPISAFKNVDEARVDFLGTID